MQDVCKRDYMWRDVFSMYAYTFTLVAYDASVSFRIHAEIEWLKFASQTPQNEVEGHTTKQSNQL